MTADIAQEHAQTRERAGQDGDARDERLAAERACQYAQRARSPAEEWHEFAKRATW